MVLFLGCLWCRVQRRAVFLEDKPRFAGRVLLGEIPEGSAGRQRYPRVQGKKCRVENTGKRPPIPPHKGILKLPKYSKFWGSFFFQKCKSCWILF